MSGERADEAAGRRGLCRLLFYRGIVVDTARYRFRRVLAAPSQPSEPPCRLSSIEDFRAGEDPFSELTKPVIGGDPPRGCYPLTVRAAHRRLGFSDGRTMRSRGLA